MTDEQGRIIMIKLPWTDHEDRRQYSMMRVTGVGITKRMVFDSIREWYKTHIGIDVPNNIIATLWQYRFETTAIASTKMEQALDDMINRMAHESYLSVTDTEDKGEATPATGE